MAIFYKQFLRSRTVFWLVFGVFCLFSAMPTTNAQAAESIFTVSGVKVDVTDKDAIKARDKAFEKAQIEAFKTLTSRVVPEDEAKAMKPPVVAVISNLIQDYEVTNEKLSAVRYIGTYTFRFDDDEVRRYFSGRGSSYTDVGSRPVLALPFWQNQRDGALLWSPYNVWLSAWNRAKGLTGLVPVVVPLGDVEDIRDISDGEALHYERRNLARLLGRYEAKEAVILIAEPDYDLSMAKTDQDTASGRLKVEIYRTDRSSPELVQELNIIAQGGETRRRFLDRAVKEVYRALQKDWKQKTVVRSHQTNRLQARVHIADLKQWAETQKSLRHVNGIERIELQSLSPKFARVNLYYQGSLDRLKLALQQADMSLETTQPEPQANGNLNRYSLDRFLSGGYNSASRIVYDLYLDKYRQTAPVRVNQAAQPTQGAYEYNFKPQTRPTDQQQNSSRYPNRYTPPSVNRDGSFRADF